MRSSGKESLQRLAAHFVTVVCARARGVLMFRPGKEFLQRGGERRHALRFFQTNLALRQLDTISRFNVTGCFPAARLCRSAYPPALEYEFVPVLSAAFVDCHEPSFPSAAATVRRRVLVMSLDCPFWL